MGQVDKNLAKSNLPDRDKQYENCSVDIAENVHLHYREYRILFSVEEFFKFASVINEAAENLIHEVDNGYKEGNLTYNDKIPNKVIGQGSGTKKLDLPNPSKSAYFNNRLVIERQVDGFRHRIHIHFRDFRICINTKETFVKICKAFTEALKNLDKW